MPGTARMCSAEKLFVSRKGNHGCSIVWTDTGPPWGLGLALLPGSAGGNLTLTSVTPATRAAALSPPYTLGTAAFEPLKRSCEHMFLLHTSGI